MRYLLLVGLVLVLASFVSAQTNIDWDNLDCASLTYQGKPIEQAQVVVPKDMADLMNGEIINLSIGSHTAVSGRTSNGILTDIRCHSAPDATLDVWVSTSTIENIVSATYPLKAFKQAKENNDIILTPREPLTMVKMFFLNIAMFFL